MVQNIYTCKHCNHKSTDRNEMSRHQTFFCLERKKEMDRRAKARFEAEEQVRLASEAKVEAEDKEKKSVHEEKKSVHEEKKSVHEDKKFVHTEKKSVHKEKKPVHEEKKPVNEEKKSVEAEDKAKAEAENQASLEAVVAAKAIEIENMKFNCACDICNQNFATTEDLADHLARVHEGKKLEAEEKAKTGTDKMVKLEVEAEEKEEKETDVKAEKDAWHLYSIQGTWRHYSSPGGQIIPTSAEVVPSNSPGIRQRSKSVSYIESDIIIAKLKMEEKIKAENEKIEADKKAKLEDEAKAKAEADEKARKERDEGTIVPLSDCCGSYTGSQTRFLTFHTPHC